jgi:hypothetical protein
MYKCRTNNMVPRRGSVCQVIVVYKKEKPLARLVSNQDGSLLVPPNHDTHLDFSTTCLHVLSLYSIIKTFAPDQPCQLRHLNPARRLANDKR